jgi:hypothetical protein
MDMAITINDDDTASGHIVMAIADEFAERLNMDPTELWTMADGELTGNLPAGATQTPWAQDGYTGTEITIPSTPIDEFASGVGDELSITREHGNYKVSGVVDMSQDMSEADMGGVDLSGVNITISITCPGAVTESNGTIAGNTVTWTPQVGERNEINAVCQARLGGSIHPAVFVGIGIAVLAIAAVLITILLMHRRERQGGTPVDAGAGDVVAGNAGAGDGVAGDAVAEEAVPVEPVDGESVDEAPQEQELQEPQPEVQEPSAEETTAGEPADNETVEAELADETPEGEVEAVPETAIEPEPEADGEPEAGPETEVSPEETPTDETPSTDPSGEPEGVTKADAIAAPAAWVNRVGKPGAKKRAIKVKKPRPVSSSLSKARVATQMSLGHTAPAAPSTPAAAKKLGAAIKAATSRINSEVTHD